MVGGKTVWEKKIEKVKYIIYDIKQNHLSFRALRGISLIILYTLSMNIKIIDKKISEAELREIAKDFYGEMVKGVVDVERGIIAMGGEYHMDANMVLIESGSTQPDVWGFNWYFDKKGDERIEYVSLINIRPGQGNKAMEVKDASLRDIMKKIILKYLP